MKRTSLIIVTALLAAACGGGALPTRTPSVSQALTGTAEWLEFESPANRAELFRDVAKQSQLQAGLTGAVLFPMVQGTSLVAAPGLDARIDLLQAPDAGAPLMLAFDTRGDRFSDDRRDAFQGLSEREATELIARSLLHSWGLRPTGTVIVTRAAGAPYAAAWTDGVLRINPAFVYLAATPAP